MTDTVEARMRKLNPDGDEIDHPMPNMLVTLLLAPPEKRDAPTPLVSRRRACRPAHEDEGPRMTERPIIFYPHEVRATLTGRQTQVRRVLKGKGAADLLCAHRVENTERGPLAREYDRTWSIRTSYRRSDTLWVREAWGINDWNYGPKDPIPKQRPPDLDDDALVYFATEDDVEIRNEMPRRPSIHMPRWASRITLRVTAVRVERLQDISEKDARAEGVTPFREVGRDHSEPHKLNFRLTWDDIHGTTGPKSWDANPWVVAISFERLDA